MPVLRPGPGTQLITACVGVTPRAVTFRGAAGIAVAITAAVSAER
jgi:hypothetical protein